MIGSTSSGAASAVRASSTFGERGHDRYVTDVGLRDRRRQLPHPTRARARLDAGTIDAWRRPSPSSAPRATATSSATRRCARSSSRAITVIPINPHETEVEGHTRVCVRARRARADRHGHRLRAAGRGCRGSWRSSRSKGVAEVWLNPGADDDAVVGQRASELGLNDDPGLQHHRRSGRARRY